ncbi:SpaH/EbpB family LPXTG-anchored major pilin [Leucobacter sp. BZR 635]
MFINKKKGPFRAALAAVAGLALLGMGATSAVAAPTIEDRTGSLTVHKFAKTAEHGDIESNGTEVKTPVGLKPMADVEFTIQQINVDLKTNAGWTAAADLTVETAAAQTKGAPIVGATDANGEYTFAELPLGLYLVTETKYPAGATPAAPFLVTVPLTDPDNRNAWLYDVHVYPKNSVTTAEKTVEDAASKKLGDEVKFQITGTIPNEKIIDGYRMTDALDPKLDYVSTTVSLANGATLTEGTDYTIAHDPATNTVTVDFTEPGRAILVANKTSKVVFDIVTTVNAIGDVKNEAVIYPNAPSFDKKPGEPGGPIVTPEVISKWGKLTIEKVDSKDKAKKLEGAEFAVFLTEKDAKAGTNAIDFGKQWVTDKNGIVTIEGLRYSEWANGIEVKEGHADYREYWLAEIKAPAEYELLAQPIMFKVDNADQKIDLTVKNVKDNGGFELPLTGGAGTALFTIVGGLLVAGAVVLTIRSRRKADA